MTESRAGMQVMFLKFSRDDESQADKLGLAYMANDGYDARSMLEVFRTLNRVSKLAGGGKLPQWLETHPDPENRLGAAEQRLKEIKHDFTGAKVNREDYLRTIDGIVYGEDPRQGFFKGQLFLHPELKFQVQFPPPPGKGMDCNFPHVAPGSKVISLRAGSFLFSGKKPAIAVHASLSPRDGSGAPC